MKSSTGIVMQLEKKHAIIMTNNGQFLKIKVSKQIPNIGEIYTGEIAAKTSFHRYAAAAAGLAFILFSGTASYAYYTPTSTVVVDINPSIELKVNRWDRILKTTPLNSDGEKVLADLNIKNKHLNDGLDLIVEEAKKDNFINQSYIDSGKIITVSVESQGSGKKPDISKFEDYAKQNNLKVNIIKAEDKKQMPSESKKNKPSVPFDKSDKDSNKESKPQNKPEEKNNNDNKGENKPAAPDKNNNPSKDKNKDEKGNNKDKISFYNNLYSIPQNMLNGNQSKYKDQKDTKKESSKEDKEKNNDKSKN